jgi:hypothetical protein
MFEIVCARGEQDYPRQARVEFPSKFSKCSLPPEPVMAAICLFGHRARGCFPRRSQARAP